jgi:hypothetical protein
MKRRFSQLQDEPVLRLELADDTSDKPPLEASSLLLHANSSCARGLPRDSDTWDLSNLLIDGQPVSRDTVTAWLNAVYKHHEDVPLEEKEPRCSPPSATGLYQLLSFADAVGSSRGVLKACLAGLEDVRLHVQTKEKDIRLQLAGERLDSSACMVAPRHLLKTRGEELKSCCCMLAGMFYYWSEGGSTDYVLRAAKVGEGRMTEFKYEYEASKEEEQAFGQQVAAQVEPLLYLAYRLQLAPLQQVLHTFIRSCMRHSLGLLYGHMRRVLSQRVMEAALASGAAQEAMLHMLAGERVVCGSGSRRHAEGADVLLAPVEMGLHDFKEPFQAAVKRVPGGDPGDVISVSLDLAGSAVQVGPVRHHCQLLIGAPLGTPALRQAALGKEAAPAADQK